MRTGWTSEDVLMMPARRFFVMLKSTKDFEAKRTNLFLADLCDISAIPLCTSEYHEQTKNMFISRVTGGTWRRGATVKMDHKDPNVAMTLQAICNQKARLEGRG